MKLVLALVAKATNLKCKTENSLSHIFLGDIYEKTGLNLPATLLLELLNIYRKPSSSKTPTKRHTMITLVTM